MHTHVHSTKLYHQNEKLLFKRKSHGSGRHPKDFSEVILGWMVTPIKICLKHNPTADGTLFRNRFFAGAIKLKMRLSYI